MTDSRGPVHLSGDLSLEVDGVGVQVHADGADLRIVADDPGAFVARVRGASAWGHRSQVRADQHRVARYLDAP